MRTDLQTKCFELLRKHQFIIAHSKAALLLWLSLLLIIDVSFDVFFTLWSHGLYEDLLR